MNYRATHTSRNRITRLADTRGTHRPTGTWNSATSCTALSLACCCCFSTVSAEEAKKTEFEAMVLVGYRSGGDFDELQGSDNPNIEPEASYGASLGWYSDSQTKYELIYDLQHTEIQDMSIDLDVEHLHLGGTAAFGGGGALQPYVAGGLGATRFNPSVGDDETRFSASLGLGVAMPIGQRIGLRLEARGYLVSMSSDSEIFCQSGPSGGNCLVRAASDTLFQYSVLGGIGVKF